MYATLDCSGGMVNVSNNAQTCQSKTKTGRTVLQDQTIFSGTVREYQTTSHFVFKFAKCACRGLKT